MKRLLIAAGVISVATLVRAEIYEFDLWTGQLNGQQEIPAVTTPAYGIEVGDGTRYDSVLNELTINVVYGEPVSPPMLGSVIGTWIWEGGIGEVGEPMIDLQPIHYPVGFNYGYFQGKVLVPESLENSLLLGRLYMNIQSTVFPWGELRGQLLVIPEPGTFALFGLGLGSLFFMRKTRS